ncbi:MAG TPA: IPT/TIG domain-containing protein [Solirubrobacteraceae bacterium]|nr:IPT/TIG domain-containing protein [Solirubrobacteraceae bacterium]
MGSWADWLQRGLVRVLCHPRRLLVLGIPVAALVAAFGVLLVIAGASSAGTTCTIYWTGASSNDWGTAANWSLTNDGPAASGTPSSTDEVCMSTSAQNTSVDLGSSTSATIAGIDWPTSGSITPSLEVDGSLTLGTASAAYASTIQNLTDEGDVTSAAAEALTVGTLSASSGAAFNGPGTLKVSGNATVTYLQLGNTAAGQLILQGTTTQSGDLVFYNGAELENRGTLNLSDSSYLDSDSNTSDLLQNDTGATIAFSGSTSSQSATINVPLANQGTVNAQEGTLVIGDGGTDTGAYTTGSSGNLQFAGARTETAGASISGNGSVDITGTLTLAANASLTVYYLQVDGTLEAQTGSNLPGADLALTVNGTLDLDSGENLTAQSFTSDGQLNGPATLTVSGTSILRYLSLGPSTAGKLILQGTTTQSGDLVLNNGAELENQGTLEVSDGTDFTSDDNSSGLLQNDTGATIAYAGSTSGQNATIDTPFTNNGTVDAVLGILNLDKLSNLSGGTLTGGTYETDGGRLSLPAAVTTNAATIVDDGSSAIVTGGNDAVAGLATNSGTLDVTRSLPLSGPFTTSGTLTLPISGTDTGSTYGQLTVSGSTTLGGTLQIQTASGYTPPVGTTFTILKAGSISGTFATVTGAQLTGESYSVSYKTTSVTLTVVASKGTQPTVTKVSPTNGPATGGTKVTISGKNFTASSTVHFGSAAAATVTYVSATRLTAVSPAENAGTVDITVTTASGTSKIVKADHYTFKPPPKPTVTKVSPASGPTAGSTKVTITGKNFAASSSVQFGSTAATTVTYVSATKLTAVSPAESDGTVDVTVTTASGTSKIVKADHYTFK